MERSPNKLLSEARLSLPSPSGSGRPMSRQELADTLNRHLFAMSSRQSVMTANYVGKLERGLYRWPHQEYRDAFRAVLGATTDSALGFFIVRGIPTSADADRPTGTVATQTDLGWADMLRRTVLRLPAALAATQLAGAASPSDRSGSLAPELVSGLVEVVGNYRRAYQAVPASRLLPAALTYLDLLSSLRPAGRREPERVPLVTAAGETATLAGVLLALDADRYADALSYLDIAWSAARSVHNVELQTVVLGCRSFAVAYGGQDHAAGLECADFARRIGATGACPWTRAWVAAVASERCASLGDLSGCKTRLEESRAVLSGAEFEEVVWRGIGGYDLHKLRAYEGGDLMRLGRFQEAEIVLDRALDGLASTMVRHRAVPPN
ncbi:MAG: hypothetical protein ACRDT4_02425 [Micromonosporaceae bacterium]